MPQSYEFQTLTEFLALPFEQKDTLEQSRLEPLYVKAKNSKGIKFIAYTVIDDNYFLHISIPSDSNPNQSYDIVVCFFTGDGSVKKQTTLSNYYVKFFSNSPSFIYKYAYLYKKEGFLIDLLYDKLDTKTSDSSPSSSNQNNKMFYDKSIYIACRYLQDNKILFLSKNTLIARKKLPKDAFFKAIKEFKDVKLTGELSTIDKQIDKELSNSKNPTSEKKPTKSKSQHGIHKIVGKTYTGPSENRGIRKVKPKRKK